MSFVRWLDSAPKLLKVILALPVLDIVWGIYRLLRSFNKSNFLGIILGILCIFLCPTILWILDLITTILQDRVLWID